MGTTVDRYMEDDWYRLRGATAKTGRSVFGPSGTLKDNLTAEVGDTGGPRPVGRSLTQEEQRLARTSFDTTTTDNVKRFIEPVRLSEAERISDSLRRYREGLGLEGNNGRRSTTDLASANWGNDPRVSASQKVDASKQSGSPILTNTKDIRDPNGIFGNGTSSSRPFGGLWSNFQEYTNYWTNKGGYINENGDFIDKNVMFKIHERSEDAVVDEKTWMGVTEKLGFLFKDDDGSKMMNDAISYAQSKLASNEQTRELANDSWSLAFVAANEISKEALAGDVGSMLKFDNDFKERFEGVRSNLSERGLHQQMHDITIGYLERAADNEGLDFDHVKSNLTELGHDTTQLSTSNYRAQLESSKNLDLVKDTDAFAARVKDFYDEHGFLPKFNVTMDYFMDARKGDSMAFASADTGLEQAQQSALKGFGQDIKFSSNPNASNELYFAVAGEEEAKKVLGLIDTAFTKAGLNPEDIRRTYGDSEATRLAEQNGVVSQGALTIHLHGGEDGTGLNQAGISSTSGPVSRELAAEMDRTTLDLGGQDADIMRDYGEVMAKFGGDRMVMNANSCHGNRHIEKAAERFMEAVADYDQANGTKSEMQLARRGVDTFGTADAQGFGDKNGYFTYKYGATGERNLEYVYSSDTRIQGQGETISETEYYDGSGQFSRDSSYQDRAREAFFGSVQEQTDSMNEYLDNQESATNPETPSTPSSEENSPAPVTATNENSNSAKKQEELIAQDQTKEAQRKQQEEQQANTENIA